MPRVSQFFGYVATRSYVPDPFFINQLLFKGVEVTLPHQHNLIRRQAHAKAGVP